MFSSGVSVDETCRLTTLVILLPLLLSNISCKQLLYCDGKDICMGEMIDYCSLWMCWKCFQNFLCLSYIPCDRIRTKIQNIINTQQVLEFWLLDTHFGHSLRSLSQKGYSCFRGMRKLVQSESKSCENRIKLSWVA